MFDFDAPKEKGPADWSGLIITVMLAPVFFLFVYLGKPELGFTTIIVLGMFIVAVRLRWQLRKYVWFWATIIVLLLLHIPLIFRVHWPQTHVPTLAYSLPLGFADFFLVSGALSLAEKVFGKNGSSDGEQA